MPKQASRKGTDIFVKSDFRSEKELEDFFEKNSRDFFVALTGKALKSIKRQYIFSHIKSSPTMRAYSFGRVDFLAEDREGTYWLIELKNTTKCQEVAHGMTQLFFYQEIFAVVEHKKCNLILVSTYFDSLIGSFAHKMSRALGSEFVFAVAKRNSVLLLKGYDQEKKDGG